VRFAFTEQQLELHQAVRSVLQRECTPGDLRALAAVSAPGAHRHGDPGRAAQRWRALADLGATGILLPEPDGGLGLGWVELVGVLEEAGRVALPEPLAESAALAGPAMAVVAASAPEGSEGRALVLRHLPDVAGGAAIATIGGVEFGSDGSPVLTTEPAIVDGSSTDHANLTTPRVPGAPDAQLALLVSGTGPGGPHLHLVETAEAWVVATPSVDPTRGLGTVEWSPAPASRLASGDQASVLIEGLLDAGALACAAQLLGLADTMIQMAADHAKARVQFGKPIGSFQAVKHHLADARVALEFARPATYRAADSMAHRVTDRSTHVSMAKSLASDAADLAARVALQVHGAIGYTWECDLHFFMKRAWALSAAWGDAVAHRRRVLVHAMLR